MRSDEASRRAHEAQAAAEDGARAATEREADLHSRAEARRAPGADHPQPGSALALGAALDAFRQAAEGYELAAVAHEELARVHDAAAGLAVDLGRFDVADQHRHRAEHSRTQAAGARSSAEQHRESATRL
jgi:hypothetical protein